MDELEAELKRFIVETLRLRDVRPEQIDAQAPLFVEGLGLDSIDALELAAAIQRRYGVAFDPTEAARRAVLASVRTLARHLLTVREGRPA